MQLVDKLFPSSDALQLLKAALADSGYIAIRGFGTGSNKDKQPRQKFFAPGAFKEAAEYAAWLSTQDYDAYFATATFTSNKTADASSVESVKCFKVDLDIDPNSPDAKYASRAEAGTALVEWCTNNDFPFPNAVVNSGFGMHAYWCLQQPMSADDGKLYSDKFKQILLAAGMKIDRTVTGDIVRVLRVPGTLNYKQTPARKVALRGGAVTALLDVDDTCDKIDALYAAGGAPEPVQPEFALGAIPAHLRGVKLDKETESLLTTKPKSFDVLMKKSRRGEGCAQMADIVDNQVGQSEHRWRAGLSIAYYCDDGDSAIHNISSKDPRYDFDATEKKCAGLVGPFKCSTFESNWPTHCLNCKHKGKITSPIQLGDYVRLSGEVSMSVAEAIEALREAEERAKAGDCGAPFEPKTIAALQALRKNDAAEFQRMRNALKKANRDVSLAELDALVIGEAASKDKSAADALISLARQHCTFFHDPDAEPHATFHRNGHRECWNLFSKGFAEWLCYQFYQSCGIAPAEPSIATALSTLAGQAKFEGEELPVAVRVAKHGSDYYIDLCDDAWKAVQVTAAGWQVIDTPPVMFVRNSAMRPLPTPVKGGDLDNLWKVANIAPDDRDLVLAWLIEAYRPDTPYPVLELCGEQGSAKSSTQSILRDLIDPNRANLRARPKTLDDLFVSAKASHVTSLENLSFLAPDWQDALCALATGAGYGGRQLYTNDAECVYEVKRPALLNGISVVATRQDLMDRTLLVSLPPIVGRRSEGEMQVEFDNAKAGIFGALLTLLSRALAILPNVQIASTDLPRMADFAYLGEAVFRALGRPDGTFLTKYQEKRRYGIAQTIESSPVAAALMAWLDKNPAGYCGTLKELHTSLTMFRPDGEQWPRSLHALGDSLRRISPALRMIGIEARHLGHKRDGHHWIIKGQVSLPA